VRVALTEEQDLLVDTVARMVSSGSDTWVALVEAGLLDVGSVEAALVTEQLARGLVAAPYAGTVLARRLAAVEGPAAVVLERSLAGLAPSGLAWDAVVGGTAVGVHGDRVVRARLSAPVDGADLTRQLIEASEAETIGAVAGDAVIGWESLALALLSADLVGAMGGALAAATAHAREREQFGRPVGSFQAVQHLCADALVLVESSRSIMWHAAWAVDVLEPADALHAARVAKAYVAESAVTVCETAIQVWGGLGMTWECDAHRYLRRVLLSRATLGDESVQLARLAA
jgi:hypothetical protein